MAGPGGEAPTVDVAALVALVAAATAGGLLIPAGSGPRWAAGPPRLGPPDAAAGEERPPFGRWRVVGLGVLGLAVLVVTTLSPSLLEGTHLAVAVICSTAALMAGRLLVRSRQAAQAAVRRQQVVDFSEALVGELRAGQPVLTALERSSGLMPDLRSVVAAARLGADVPLALHRVAIRPGAEGLSQLAAAWQLCATTGAGLAAAAGQVLDTARGDAAALRLVEAEIASARATAQLVAALPVVVLWAASGIGVDPWAFLLGSAVGVGCLAAGVALLFSGLWWIDRIAESALRGGA